MIFRNSRSQPVRGLIQQTNEVILVAVITMGISFIATLFPSAKASNQNDATADARVARTVGG